jgi:hypothetical protein
MDNGMNYQDLNTIRKMGIEALTKELGPVGMAQFMKQFETGHGNYTAERGKWLDGYTLEDIIGEIEKK